MIDVVEDAAAPLAATKLQVDGLDVVKDSLTSSGLSAAMLAEDVAVILVEPVAVATAHQVSSVITPFDGVALALGQVPRAGLGTTHRGHGDGVPSRISESTTIRSPTSWRTDRRRVAPDDFGVDREGGCFADFHDCHRAPLGVEGGAGAEGEDRAVGVGRAGAVGGGVPTALHWA